MSKLQEALFRAMEQTLRFEYYSGGVTPIIAHDSGWRTVNGLTVAHHERARGRLKIEGREDSRIGAGDTMYVPPGALHRFILDFRGEGISRWAMVDFYILGSVNVFHFLHVPSILRGSVSEKVREINEELHVLRSNPQASLTQVFRERAAASRLLMILAESAAASEENLEFLQAAGRLAPALHFIQEHLAEDIRGSDLAKLVHLSTSRFGAVFRAVLGKAPGEYILNHRIDRARQLLTVTDLGVQEIGLKVGYGDPFHFSRIFKQHCRVSPRLYRQNIRQGLISG